MGHHYDELTDHGRRLSDVVTTVVLILGLASLVVWMFAPGR